MKEIGEVDKTSKVFGYISAGGFATGGGMMIFSIPFPAVDRLRDIYARYANGVFASEYSIDVIFNYLQSIKEIGN